MADTYTLISSVTVGAGGASSIDFTSIPATYTDLLVRLSGRSNATTAKNEWLYLTLNSSTSNFSYRLLQGNPTSVGSFNGTTQFIGDIPTSASGTTASTFGSADIYIPNYAGSTYKSISIDAVTEGNYTDNILDLTASLWSNTASITAVSLSSRNGNWLQYSTAYLYGIYNS